MSAQTLTAGLANGIVDQGEPAPQGQSGAIGSEPLAARVAGEYQPHGMGQQTARAEDLEVRDEARAGDPRPVPEATAGPTQAVPGAVALTTQDSGRQAGLEQVGTATMADDSPGVFRTPRAMMTPTTTTQPQWLAGVEPPRWLTRLGNMLNLQGHGATAAELAPSPFPSRSPVYTPPPPGGQAFRLRSPTRARAISAAPTPPSSSSVPAEAIQAEVQRQLQGIMGQLREYGDRNQRLSEEPRETQERLREAQERGFTMGQGQVRHERLLGDLATAQLEVRFVNPYNLVLQYLEVKVAPEYPKYQNSPEPPEWSMNQWEEMVVLVCYEPGTVSLTMMPDVKEGADAALSFQDWLEVSNSVMCDISEGSSAWWAGILEGVQDTYATWLSASPLEKLTIEPKDTEKWRRVGMLSYVDTLPKQVDASVGINTYFYRHGNRSATNASRYFSGWHPMDSGDIRVSSMTATTTALLDSGATHSLRTATAPEEWEEAEPVSVQLAGSCSLMMRINEAGTLLMPCRMSRGDGSEGQPGGAQTIVPMGQLIETLGYSLQWTPQACTLVDPEGMSTTLRIQGGCPQLQEMEALSLIAKIEDRKLEMLRNSTLTTSDALKVTAMSMSYQWDYYLLDYVKTGCFDSGLRAVRDAPFLSDLPGECLHELVPAAGLWSGWDIMKNIGFLSRPQRRKLWSSKKWVVHLFAGDPGHWPIFKLDSGETTVLELDVARNAGQNVMRGEVWQMLLWAAKEGKIDVVLGGPPDRASQHAKGGARDAKALALVARMMWLHAVAQVGREVNGGPVTRDREVGFVLEYPEGMSREAQGAAIARENACEDMTRAPDGQGSPATWTQATWLWENVQGPRWERAAGASTVDARISFWDTRMWKAYQRLSGFRTVSFDQGAMGGDSVNPTTLGTNINNLLSLDELRVPEGTDLPRHGPNDYKWAPGLVDAVVVALSFWERDPRCAPRLPRLQALSPEQWKKHVNSNHADYRRDCATCVMSRGVGRRHRRVHHPEAYVLTADVAGPLSPGLDPTSKGTMGKNIKYMLVAKYLVPKEFVEQKCGRVPPDDHGMDSSDSSGARADKDTAEDEKFQDPFDLNAMDGEPEDYDAEITQVPDGAPLNMVVQEELEYEPSLPPDEEPDDRGGEPPEELDDDERVAPIDMVMSGGVCKPPEMTYLTFGVGLVNNQAKTIKTAVQDIVLYLEMHGFQIYRFHSDKGEFFNHQFRSWLRDQAIYGTWSEPGVPQSNGQAESTVRWVKDRARTFLQASSLPTRLWPTAVAAATAEQRAKVLGWKSYLAAPYGAPVVLKKKAFDKHGPLRREQGLDTKWLKARYAGLSTILHHGHLVYIPAKDGEREKFLHTLHVRPNLIDPGEPDIELEADLPKPRRRLSHKSPMEEIQLRGIRVKDQEVMELATGKAKEIVEHWDVERAKALVIQLAYNDFFNEVKFGVFRHGGAVGWMKGFNEFPDLAKLLARIVTDEIPEATFTSVLISHNTLRTLHKDLNNDSKTDNYVIPLLIPRRGGEVWVELRPGDTVKGTIEQRKVNEREIYGHLHPLEEGSYIKFGPRRYHEVNEWEGDRIVLIAYSPQCLGKLGQAEVELLHEHGYAVPLSQLPEYCGDDEIDPVLPHVRSMELETTEEKNDCDPEWSMYLDLEPGAVKIADSSTSPFTTPLMAKTEVSYTNNIEGVLSSLKGPLDVTHTVRPSEVIPNLELWRPAIEKEMRNIEVAIERLVPGSDLRRQWLNKPGVQRLPMKFVFTVKPNDQAIASDPTTWFKRKARLVVCGNMAEDSGASVYTEAAPAEAVRAGLAVTVKNAWSIAVLDVVAAFLKTPMGRARTDPIVVVQPPRLLELMGLVTKMELWALIRALYGLRQSPALWGDFRDYTLRTVNPPKGLKLQQGRAATSWWRLVDENNCMVALVLVYVDDFLLCGPREIIRKLAAWIQEFWDTSELKFLLPGASARFLGMELYVDENHPEEIRIGQQGYVQELLRLHQVPETQLDKVPVTKELVADREPQSPPTKEDIHMAQQLTGEILWVAQRSRPDLGFTTLIMASLCLRQPQQAIEIGRKVLGYLQRTLKFQLKVVKGSSGLIMYCDAAYAPQGTRSHGGWLVMYNGVPIVWRSGRQQMITLSTAEAELLAMIDGAIAMKGVEALLMDVNQVVEEKTIASDSMSALRVPSGDIQLDRDLVGTLMLLLMLLGGLLIWEAVKWACVEAYQELEEIYSEIYYNTYKGEDHFEINYDTTS
ncbi:TY5A [Symbiodinium sp. CCMP2592]|nr:TY5A [Symbiodinium sp. CCMP2592]